MDEENTIPVSTSKVQLEMAPHEKKNPDESKMIEQPSELKASVLSGPPANVKNHEEVVKKSMNQDEMEF